MQWMCTLTMYLKLKYIITLTLVFSITSSFENTKDKNINQKQKFIPDNRIVLNLRYFIRLNRKLILFSINVEMAGT